VTANLYREAKNLLNQNRFAEALSVYEKLAGLGDVKSQVFVGRMTYKGLGAPKDVEKAFAWFQKAASLGSSAGAFFCGRMLVTQGRYVESEAWFSTAAREDYSAAVLWMGLLRTRRLLENPDFETGLAYVQRAARLGNFLAKRELIQIMLSGRFGFLGILRGIALFPITLVCALIEVRFNGISHKVQG